MLFVALLLLSIQVRKWSHKQFWELNSLLKIPFHWTLCCLYYIYLILFYNLHKKIIWPRNRNDIIHSFVYIRFITNFHTSERFTISIGHHFLSFLLVFPLSSQDELVHHFGPEFISISSWLNFFFQYQHCFLRV